MAERLQKVISAAGIASRRLAEELIKSGRVTVDGVVVTKLGTTVEVGKSVVRVDGKLLSREKPVYIMLNKPRGVVTTVKDPRGRKTVLDLVAEIPQRVYPVGRLDYATEGLLIMTNDGELTNNLIHPSRHVNKTYLATVSGLTGEKDLDLLRAGVNLKDGLTAPAAIKIIDVDGQRNRTTLEITIHEGKNRQIRRMFDLINQPVLRLKRIRFGRLTLDGLKPGQYRQLSAAEVNLLKKGRE